MIIIILKMIKIQLNLLPIFLISIWTPIIPIHFISLEDIEWFNWTDLQHIFTLQYPSLDYWKIIEEGNQNNSNLSHVIYHMISEILIKRLMMIVMTLPYYILTIVLQM
jgi:hypothetical protein